MGGRSGNRKPDPDAPSLEGKLRLDKWIWFARFQRSREVCADLVRSGHVRVNARKVTQPGSFVGIGDILTLALPGQTLVIKITALAERRADAAAAALLYRPVEAIPRSDGKND
jgi:ribosome-associated heat shock protein Hsp15